MPIPVSEGEIFSREGAANIRLHKQSSTPLLAIKKNCQYLKTEYFGEIRNFCTNFSDNYKKLLDSTFEVILSTS